MGRKQKNKIIIGSVVSTARDLSPAGRLVRKNTRVTIIANDSVNNSIKVLFDGREFWLHKDDIKH